jgi:hypothetical protein
MTPVKQSKDGICEPLSAYAEIPLGHHLLQAAVTKRIAQIPANAQDDDLTFEMPSL